MKAFENITHWRFTEGLFVSLKIGFHWWDLNISFVNCSSVCIDFHSTRTIIGIFPFLHETDYVPGVTFFFASRFIKVKIWTDLFFHFWHISGIVLVIKYITVTELKKPDLRLKLFRMSFFKHDYTFLFAASIYFNEQTIYFIIFLWNS